MIFTIEICSTLDYLIIEYFFLCPIFQPHFNNYGYLEKIIAEMIIVVQQKNLFDKKFQIFISSEVYCKINIFPKSPSITNESSEQNKYAM